MLKYGIVGAANGAFISDVHIRAIEATHKAELAAGCFSRNPEKNKAAAEYRGVDADRTYAAPAEMAQAESEREDGIDFVVITTPNTSHYAIAKAFLEAGINVSSDKPVTTEGWQAAELKEIARAKGLKFCVTFTYSGYPALRHAREVIRSGQIGDVVMATGEYVQGWLAGETEVTPWRTDPAMVGRTNALADIGSHAEFVIEYLTGMKLKEVCCQLDYTGGFQTDTNSVTLQKYDNGATGTIWATQIATGKDNEIAVRICGTKGMLEWENASAETFKLTIDGYPMMIVSKGNEYSALPQLSSTGRLPAGHHEGLYYAFANIYENFLDDLAGKEAGYYPTIQEGYDIVHWLDCCWESHQKHAWVEA